MLTLTSYIPLTLAVMANFLMLLIGFSATFSPSSFVGIWLKRGADCKEGTPGYFFTVGGTGAGALSIAVTSLLSLLRETNPFLQTILTNSRSISCGTLAILWVYLNMWYKGDMAKRLGASRMATDGAVIACLGTVCYAFCKGSSDNKLSEEAALRAIQWFHNGMVPWTLAHYVFPRLLQTTFRMNVTDGETVLLRSACTFFLANQILQASLARGINPVRSVAYMALVMMLSSLDFQRYYNPKWGVGNVPEGVEIDWSKVNGYRTWSIVSLGIVLFQ